MSEVDSIALSVDEYATGANGELDHHEQVSRVADGVLIDWCYEYLAEYDIKLDLDVMAVVRRLVAAAMSRQHAHDTGMWSRVFSGLNQSAESQTD
jgi:hypothetical protein